MRTHILGVLLLPALVACMRFPVSGYLRDAEQVTITAVATPAFGCTPGSLMMTSVPVLDSSEIRQIPAAVPIADALIQELLLAVTTSSIVRTGTIVPAIPAPVNTPESAPIDDALIARVAPAPAVPPAPVIDPAANTVPPASSTNSAVAAGVHSTGVTAPFSNVPFVTIQWAETFIGGTYSTWLPHTVSFDFKPERTEIPTPGMGQIGMGTLTGKTGQTQTVVEVVGAAAPTQGPGWGVAAMIGVGIVGIV